MKRDPQTMEQAKQYIDQLEERAARAEGRFEDEVNFNSRSAAMSRVTEIVTNLRRDSMRGDETPRPVLITGDEGTGRELIARTIHKGSRSGKGSWIVVNCAGRETQQLETEIFGAGNGPSGCLDLANGGTLYLERVEYLPVALQTKLTAVFRNGGFQRIGTTETRRWTGRVIASAKRDIRTRVTENRFDREFFQVLSQVTIELPTLKERSEDLLPMATAFAERAFQERGKRFRGFNASTTEFIKTYAWPGNVWELWNFTNHCAMLVNSDAEVDLGAVVYGGRRDNPASKPLQAVTNPFDAPGEQGVKTYTELKRRWSDSFERDYLTAILARHGGNVSAAAREAGLDRSNFLRLLRRHGLKAQTYRKAA